MYMRSVSELFRVAVVVVSLVGSGCGAVREYVSPPEPSRVDEVKNFKPVTPERWVLPNGLSVIYVRDDELPLVRGALLMRGGALWATRFPVGTTSAMGDNMRLGGAGDLSSDALDKELEKLAAGITSSFSAEFGSVAFSCMAGDTEQVFSLFADVVLRPRYESEKLSLWKGQALEGIRRRVEDPSTVATVAFSQLLYNDTPYGKVSRSKDITAISRADILDLHRYLVRPDGAILVVTGKIDRESVARLAEKYLGGWEARGSALPPPPPINTQPKPGIYFVTLPFAQASVKLGHLGVPRFTPDYPAIDVFNEVFGSSGFGSRLMKRVRTDLGLSYGVYGGIAPGVVRGSNAVFLQTKAESVGPAIVESIAVLKKLQNEDPTREELSEKSSAIENSFVFNFGSMDEIAGRMARQELMSYPPDYDATYLQKIRAVSPKEVREVAKSRWDPAQFVILIVGNEAALAALEAERAKPSSSIASFELNKLSFDEALTGIP